MCVGSTSPASTAALGLPVRNGSMRTRLPPSLNSKQACPRKRMSIGPLSSALVQFSCQFPADRHAYQHSHPGLIGEEGADPDRPLLRVDRVGRRTDLALVRLAEPAAALERVRQDALELRGD